MWQAYEESYLIKFGDWLMKTIKYELICINIF